MWFSKVSTNRTLKTVRTPPLMTSHVSSVVRGIKIWELPIEHLTSGFSASPIGSVPQLIRSNGSHPLCLSVTSSINCSHALYLSSTRHSQPPGAASIVTMNVLESPIDALALGHVSYGILNIVNNLWTWVAFVTAAVSFWRIRAAGTASFSVKCVPPVSQKVRKAPSPDIPVENNPRLQTSVPAASSEAVGGVTRGKFTVYYENEGEIDGGLAGVREWDYKESDVLSGDWWERWENVLGTRSGEMSWYSYQDLTAINGNVVRLWDGGV